MIKLEQFVNRGVGWLIRFDTNDKRVIWYDDDIRVLLPQPFYKGCILCLNGDAGSSDDIKEGKPFLDILYLIDKFTLCPIGCRT